MLAQKKAFIDWFLGVASIYRPLLNFFNCFGNGEFWPKIGS